ncbi:unnamed protein product [Caenorhabditis bovis]|uniref:Uncharacterized protein n=1 Tax=Caenorhabditis bovis TaxID=2654633 RepID=A0A8S1FCJ5_9PELO|nr:unnamed protein product [Caenorhabditis bovis]
MPRTYERDMDQNIGATTGPLSHLHLLVTPMIFVASIWLVNCYYPMYPTVQDAMQVIAADFTNDLKPENFTKYNLVEKLITVKAQLQKMVSMNIKGNYNFIHVMHLFGGFGFEKTVTCTVNRVPWYHLMADKNRLKPSSAGIQERYSQKSADRGLVLAFNRPVSVVVAFMIASLLALLIYFGVAYFICANRDSVILDSIHYIFGSNIQLLKWEGTDIILVTLALGVKIIFIATLSLLLDQYYLTCEAKGHRGGPDILAWYEAQLAIYLAAHNLDFQEFYEASNMFEDDIKSY